MILIDKRITYISKKYMDKLKLIALNAEKDAAQVIEVADEVSGNVVKVMCYKNKINNKPYVEGYPLLPLPNDNDFMESAVPTTLLN